MELLEVSLLAEEFLGLEALAISPGLLLAFNRDVGYKSLAYEIFRI